MKQNYIKSILVLGMASLFVLFQNCSKRTIEENGSDTKLALSGTPHVNYLASETDSTHSVSFDELGNVFVNTVPGNSGREEVSNTTQDTMICDEVVGESDYSCEVDGVANLDYFTSISSTSALSSGNTWSFNKFSNVWSLQYDKSDIEASDGFKLRHYFYNPDSKILGNYLKIIFSKTITISTPPLAGVNTGYTKFEETPEFRIYWVNSDSTPKQEIKFASGKLMGCSVTEGVNEEHCSNLSSYVSLSSLEASPSGEKWTFWENIDYWAVIVTPEDLAPYKSMSFIHYYYDPETGLYSKPLKTIIGD